MERQTTTFPTYLVAYACLDCRKAFKRNDHEGVLTLACPNCGHAAHRTSRSFKPPKQSDLEQWSKVSYPRELESLGLIAQGLSNKELGERVFFSENTVKSHASRLFDKLGAPAHRGGAARKIMAADSVSGRPKG